MFIKRPDDHIQCFLKVKFSFVIGACRIGKFDKLENIRSSCMRNNHTSRCTAAIHFLIFLVYYGVDFYIYIMSNLNQFLTSKLDKLENIGIRTIGWVNI